MCVCFIAFTNCINVYNYDFCRRYVAVVIIPLKTRVPRSDAVEVRITCGYAQEMAYPAT